MLRLNKSNFSKMVILMAGIVLLPLLTGCSGGDSNPMESPAPAPEPIIETPKAMHITSIKVTGFAKNKSNGDTWDWDPLFADPRKPDIYVSLQRPGYFPAYSSDTRKNANYTSTYTFTKPASIYDGSLPRDIPYGQSYKIYLVDDDNVSNNDAMGSVTVNPSSLYGKDNAQSFAIALNGSNSVKIKIYGYWLYQ